MERLDKEYIIISIDNADHETYDYSNNRNRALKFAKDIQDFYKHIIVKEISYSLVGNYEVQKVIWEK